ncbi:MAG: hypothetical protein LJE67_10410 [Salaquimonas sp.]|nr:hypothetical protein [Salaquimonas sp.]
MTKIRKTLSTAIAIAVLSTSGAAAVSTSASAAGMTRLAPIESTANQATQVHYYGGGYGYGYFPHCWWVKRRLWGYYGWRWHRVRICR